MNTDLDIERKATLTLSDALKRAAQYYKAGQLDQAEQLYGAILAANPQHRRSLVNLSIIAHRRGNLEQAIRRLREAIAAKQRSAADFVECANLMGVFKQWTDAAGLLTQALTMEPNHLAAHLKLGDALVRVNRKAEALASYDRALSIDPASIEALAGRGAVLRELRRSDEAKKVFEQVLNAQPDNVDALHGLGAALGDLGKGDDAIDLFDQALAIEPDRIDVLVSRAVVLRRLKRPKEALAVLDRAAAIDPDVAAAINLRGNCLRDMGRPEEAVEHFNRLLDLAPNEAVYLNNRAGALIECGIFEQAHADAQRSLSIKPDYAGAKVNLAVLQLRQEDYKNGWPMFEARWSMEKGLRRRPFRKPLWLGNASLQDKTILLHAEQGIGDTIQFIRFAPLIAKRAGAVIVEVQQSLKSLDWVLPGVKTIVGRGDGWPAFDYYCPLLSLPAALNIDLTNIPVDIPYLKPSPAHVPKWQNLLHRTKLRVGIAWSGNPSYRADFRRSMRLRRLAPLFELTNVEFVSLQLDADPDDTEYLRENRQILHPAAKWDETTAIISQLDLVISVDTSISHFAGAMGIPVWIMLSQASDYRWFDRREDSPWYPTVRLFRQVSLEDWEEVIIRVRDELRVLAERNQRNNGE